MKPTDLELIREWPCESHDDARRLLTFVRGLWTDGNWREVRKEHFFLETCQEEGNEELIDALMDNNAFWNMAWWASMRGGMFEFRLES